MKAMILAAGLGTRLKEHTQDKPKALVEVEGKTLLAYVLEKLVDADFNEIVVNVHHFADQIVGYIESRNFGVKIHISDESSRLLNTGGGILKAKSFLDGDEPFLVHNVDILSDINLKQLMQHHIENDSLATLAVGDRKSSRKFLFDEQMRLSGWRNTITDKVIIPDSARTNIKEFAFAGIHVINPEFFNLIHTKGPFSIVDAYLSLCSKYNILGFDTTQNFVLDIGKVPSLDVAKEYLQTLN
ncbi:MAG: nucleotidyltransferase [Bacteroidetes bacterium HGW-Bacteroidetes-15]|nr:MAG: nucleotidyltransferase [Bacteroidetes bacterium HGW-Bacteroidetes-15]